MEIDMLNFLWAGMIIIGVIWGIATGQAEAVGNSLLEGAKDAVELCIGMAGVVGAWCGLMEIARRAGIEKALAQKLKPVVKFFFPGISPDHPSINAICINLTANILGLGWAATPAGLAAMRELESLKEEQGKVKRDTASDEMCTFLVINISSLQLIPVNMIAYRSSYGSRVPAAIVGPGILATAASTFAAVCICNIMTKSPFMKLKKSS